MLMPGFYLQTAAIALIIGYLFGNFPSAVLISRLLLKDDIRRHGSGNPGSTNMKRTFGNKWGYLTFLLDAGKCAAAILLGQWMGSAWGLIPANPALGTALAGYFAGTGAVIGHCYPVLLRFRGGKGSACNYAFVCMTFLWPCGVITAAASVLVYLFCRRISAVSLAAALLFFVFTAAGGADRPFLWCFALVNGIVIFIRHKDNIKRLIAGTESTVDY